MNLPILVFGLVAILHRLLYSTALTYENRVRQGHVFRAFRFIERFIVCTSVIEVTLVLILGRAPVLVLLTSGYRLQCLGSLVSLVGLVLLADARYVLERHYSPCDDARIPEGLTSAGPYGYCRHPMYLGNILIATGVAIATGSLLGALNLLLLVSCYRYIITLEEDALVRAFPEYAPYRQQVSALMPRIPKVEES